MLRRRSAARRDKRVDLQLRVHLLCHLRRRCSGRHLPQLRWQPRRTSNQTGRHAGQKSRIEATNFQTPRLPSGGMSQSSKSRNIHSGILAGRTARSVFTKASKRRMGERSATHRYLRNEVMLTAWAISHPVINQYRNSKFSNREPRRKRGQRSAPSRLLALPAKAVSTSAKSARVAAGSMARAAASALA